MVLGGGGAARGSACRAGGRGRRNAKSPAVDKPRVPVQEPETKSATVAASVVSVHPSAVEAGRCGRMDGGTRGSAVACRRHVDSSRGAVRRGGRGGSLLLRLVQLREVLVFAFQGRGDSGVDPFLTGVATATATGCFRVRHLSLTASEVPNFQSGRPRGRGFQKREP